ncbi:hypothetical protein RM545_01935 [Zunongwangia sp. F260]|uniref:Lipocalin-like domain-containing protein n=1 Tax=Autumnicola lenta TaxID=3075593 RepID=A0ABU3CGM8_9FLAO|nr:hypothetical protein [Zunongwangia sp. F260]MDT0645436.1 hypothetical protein [Zunongwangia sp. F260]
MNFPFQFLKKIFLLLILVSAVGCSTDQDDDLKEYNIEGRWKYEANNRYNYYGDLIRTRSYGIVWEVTKDSIQRFQTFDLTGENMTGTMSFSSTFAYETFPDGSFSIFENKYQIKSLTENEFIFQINRPDYILEAVLYRIDE